MKAISTKLAGPIFIGVVALSPFAHAMEINTPKITTPHVNVPRTPQLNTHVITPSTNNANITGARQQGPNSGGKKFLLNAEGSTQGQIKGGDPHHSKPTLPVSAFRAEDIQTGTGKPSADGAGSIGNSVVPTVTGAQNPTIGNSVSPTVGGAQNPTISNSVSSTVGGVQNPTISSSVSPTVSGAQKPTISDSVSPTVGGTKDTSFGNSLNPTVSGGKGVESKTTNSNPQQFETSTAPDGNTVVNFGDGATGQAPPTGGSNINGTYRFQGNGLGTTTPAQNSAGGVSGRVDGLGGVSGTNQNGTGSDGLSGQVTGLGGTGTPIQNGGGGVSGRVNGLGGANGTSQTGAGPNGLSGQVTGLGGGSTPVQNSVDGGSVSGRVRGLGGASGSNPTGPNQVNPVDSEQNITNFRIISDY